MSKEKLADLFQHSFEHYGSDDWAAAKIKLIEILDAYGEQVKGKCVKLADANGEHKTGNDILDLKLP